MCLARITQNKQASEQPSSFVLQALHNTFAVATSCNCHRAGPLSRRQDAWQAFLVFNSLDLRRFWSIDNKVGNKTSFSNSSFLRALLHFQNKDQVLCLLLANVFSMYFFEKHEPTSYKWIIHYQRAGPCRQRRLQRRATLCAALG